MGHARFLNSFENELAARCSLANCRHTDCYRPIHAILKRQALAAGLKPAGVGRGTEHRLVGWAVKGVPPNVRLQPS